MATVTPDAPVVDRVKTLTAWDQRPALTDAQVTASIQAHPLVDADGLTADQADWTPTWDVYAAAAELWGIKAGLVAGDFTFSADGGQFSKGDVMAHCLAMETKYASMASGSTSTTRYASGYRGDTDRLIING